MVGKFGLERQYNDMLMGVDGQRRVVVDSIGRERQDARRTKKSTPGNNLQLTLDLDLQAVAELAHGREARRGGGARSAQRRGAGDGEPAGVRSEPVHRAASASDDWKAMTSDPNNPLMNRAIQAQFAPGSTFKPIVTIAALETGTIDRKFRGASAPAARPSTATSIAATRSTERSICISAIVHSCDTYFYTVGNKLGIDAMAEYGQMAGIGKKTGIDLPGEAGRPDAVDQVEAADAARKMVRRRDDFGRHRPGVR